MALLRQRKLQHALLRSDNAAAAGKRYVVHSGVPMPKRLPSVAACNPATHLVFG
jgi:hypothetical protein